MIALLFWFAVAVIFYTYAGYPLALAFLASLKKKQAWPQDYEPKVTLVIAAYNEEAVLPTKLENSTALDYPREILQILVAADGSDDRTCEIVRSFASQGVELSYQPRRQGKLAALARALPRVRGEIMVFSDANNFYLPDTIRKMVRPFQDPKVGGVSGAKMIITDENALAESEGLYWKYESFIKSAESRLSNCTAVSGEVLAVRRSVFELPPENIINEDFYIALRIIKKGLRIAYVPKARSFEHVSPTAQDEIERRSRMIAGRYQAMELAGELLPWDQPLTVWQVISHKFMRPIVPIAMFTALFTNAASVIQPGSGDTQSLLGLGVPYNYILLSLQALFYFIAWLGNQVTIPGKVGKILYLPTFLLNSNLAALVGLFRFAARSQKVVWQRVARREDYRN